MKGGLTESVLRLGEVTSLVLFFFSLFLDCCLATKHRPHPLLCCWAEQWKGVLDQVSLRGEGGSEGRREGGEGGRRRGRVVGREGSREKLG